MSDVCRKKCKKVFNKTVIKPAALMYGSGWWIINKKDKMKINIAEM